MFSHFSRTPTCDGHVGQTHGHSIYRESIARAVKMEWFRVVDVTWSVTLSVCVCVCLLHALVGTTETSEQIMVPFLDVDLGGPKEACIVGPGGRGFLWRWAYSHLLNKAIRLLAHIAMLQL